MSDLPAHSPLGASSAERWMNCPGSVNLIRQLAPDSDSEEPDYRRDGTQAHALAAHCLENDLEAWEADPTEFPELTSDMMQAVQEYLEFVREQHGSRKVEVRVHVPEFHPAFYGTLDCVVRATLDTGGSIHVIDYKHGVGVVVDAEDNPQLKYYAYGDIATWGAPDFWPVKLTIVQPRAFHPDGAIRTWETTVGEIRRWAEEELRPAMEATQDLDYLALGQWCRFCPAKLVCPAFGGLANKALNTGAVSYAEAQQLKMLVKAIEDETFKRLCAGETLEDAKLVAKKANRVFKDDAPLEATFGADAFKPPAHRSVAEIEKLPGGKVFVHEFAFKPDAGLTVALKDDARSAVVPKDANATFQKYLDSTM